MNATLKFIIAVNCLFTVGLIYYVATLNTRINEERDRLEKIRCQQIVDKINKNRKVLDIEPLSPSPTNYGEVLEAIFDTSSAFMKKSGVE